MTASNLKQSIADLTTVANSADGGPSDHILIAQMTEEQRSLLDSEKSR
jgi:hypothetical protein